MVRLVTGSMEEVEIMYEGKKQLKKKRRRVKNDLLRVPEEIMLNIISRLPVDSVLDCRRVCKTWRNLPLLRHDNHFAYMHLRRQQLLLHDDHINDEYHHDHSTRATIDKVSFVYLGSSDNSLYYVEYDENDAQSYNTYKRINLLLPDDTESLVGSCNGLICLGVCRPGKYYSYEPIYICNPITREFMHLPRFEENGTPKYSSMAYGFGYHPSTNEYKVVRIYYCHDRKPAIGQVQVYTLGSGIGWRNKGELNHTLEPNIASHGVLLNGALHWLSKEGNIVAFDLADEEFRCLPKIPGSLPDWYLNSNLWVLGGWLCVTHRRTYTDADIWLLKKNINEKQSTSGDDDDMKQQEIQSWTWSREFTIEISQRYRMHQPFAITKRGKILLWCEAKTIVCCDPKPATKFKKLGNLDEAINGMQVISHFNSFVSLKALGENAHAYEINGAFDTFKGLSC